jgi:hypothetical protein
MTKAGLIRAYRKVYHRAHLSYAPIFVDPSKRKARIAVLAACRQRKAELKALIETLTGAWDHLLSAVDHVCGTPSPETIDALREAAIKAHLVRSYERELQETTNEYHRHHRTLSQRTIVISHSVNGVSRLIAEGRTIEELEQRLCELTTGSNSNLA